VALGPPALDPVFRAGLATAVLAYFAPRFHQTQWTTHVVALLGRGPAVLHAAAVAAQLVHTFSIPLPVDTLQRQVEASVARFEEASGGLMNPQTSPWTHSPLVQRYLLPPADMLVVCPRCHVPRCMLNQFVASGSTKVQVRFDGGKER
jgi:hypothetical protein